ncbi:MAG: MarR family transcriptional regulator [Thiomonas sp. 20-64-5]|nr:MAG: MarR family transcriptional regulator [Thiomonas sp. 20-64-5]
MQSMGLTPAQFDVLATLGNTEGMNPKRLSEKTLITKGTLTGVVDRLLAKGLAQRLPDPADGRGQIVRLTPEGQAAFEQVFPAHGAHLALAFARLDAAQRATAEQALQTLRLALEQANAEGAGE